MKDYAQLVTDKIISLIKAGRATLKENRIWTSGGNEGMGYVLKAHLPLTWTRNEPCYGPFHIQIGDHALRLTDEQVRQICNALNEARLQKSVLKIEEFLKDVS